MASENAPPEGWAPTRRGSVASPSKAKVDPAAKRRAQYLSLGHIESGTARVLGHGTGADVTSTKTEFHAGDVLYGKLRPYLNKVFIPGFDGICSTDILVFPQSQHVDSRFLLHVLMSPRVVAYANHNMTGVQLPRISFEKLAELEFALAPAPEQKRIVEMVEKLLARLDAARARLYRVPAILKCFREAVLAAACSGRLTEEWRDSRPAEASPTDSVDGPALPKPDAELVAVGGVEELPEGWLTCPLDALRDPRRSISYGVLKPGPFEQGGVPLLRIKDILEEPIDLDAVHRIPRELSQQYRRTVLQSGELLVSLVGTVGRIALVPAGFKGVNVHRNLAVVAPGPRIHGPYLRLALSSPAVQRQIGHTTSGANQPLFNLGALRRMVIPVPPYAEQAEIVRRVQSLFALADAIEQRVELATARASKLKQAVLARAFRGELVPTEAELARREGRSYEPASELLASIRAEREAREAEAEETKKTKRRKAWVSKKARGPRRKKKRQVDPEGAGGE